VEDNPGDLFLLEETLRLSRLPYEHIFKATSAAAAIKILNEQTLSVVLLDLSLPDSSGYNSYEQVSEYASSIPIIVLTGLADMDLALETMASGAQDYLIKGEFDERLLAKSIQYSIERNRIRLSLMESNERYQNLFFNNPMPIIIWDIETLRIMEANETAQIDYGYTRDELLSMTVLALRPESEYDKIKAFARTFLETNAEKKSAVWNHQKKNGESMVVCV
jgi:PAS domain S-box-containing protein